MALVQRQDSTVEAENVRDSWLNVGGFRVITYMNKANLFEFWLDPDNPLTLELEGLGKLQPDRHYERTDGGSIPRPLWWVPGLEPTRFLRSFIFHDSGYFHGGLWLDGAFVSMTRAEVDTVLYRGTRAEGGNKFVTGLIYNVVRGCGWVAWNHRTKHRAAEAKKRPRK